MLAEDFFIFILLSRWRSEWFVIIKRRINRIASNCDFFFFCFPANNIAPGNIMIAHVQFSSAWKNSIKCRYRLYKKIKSTYGFALLFRWWKVAESKDVKVAYRKTISRNDNEHKIDGKCIHKFILNTALIWNYGTNCECSCSRRFSTNIRTTWIADKNKLLNR